MKLVIQRNELLSPLLTIIGAIEKRQTMPMLANVLIEAREGKIHFTATDMEITLTSSVAYEQAKTPDAAALPARKLLDICKALPEGSEIQLEANSEKCTLKAGHSRFTLVCLPPEDFPTLERSGSTSHITLPAGTLRGLLEKTSFAMANQDVRYYLNGLMFEIFPKGLRTVATDGHRLAFSHADIEIGEAVSEQVIVPRKGVIELQRLLGDEEGEVDLFLAAKHIRVVTENGEFVSKLIDGKFPDYQRVIPQDSGNELTIDKRTLKEALQRASILSNEKYRGIRLVLDKNLLTLQAHNSEQEEAEEQLDIEFDGMPLAIGFNVQYLLDVTNVLSGQEINLSLKDSNSSVLLKDPEDVSSQYVIMPMRL